MLSTVHETPRPSSPQSRSRPTSTRELARRRDDGAAYRVLECCSADAARSSTRSRLRADRGPTRRPAALPTCPSSGCRLVEDNARDARCPAFSRTSPPLKSIPSCAPTPDPTITAVGVASPRVHGHAMTNARRSKHEGHHITVGQAGQLDQVRRHLAHTADAHATHAKSDRMTTSGTK